MGWKIQGPLYSSDDNLSVSLGENDDDGRDDDESREDNEGEGNESESEEGDEDEDKERKEGKGEDEEVLTRVEFKEVKDKFPDLFKTFPDLKHAFFREQKFTEIFPTVEDAQKAADAQAAYEEITAAVVDGDAEKFISELEGESKEGLAAFANNLLPALQKVNKDLYFDVVTPQVKNFVRWVFDEGARNKDVNIQNAAKIVHKALFGGAYEDIEKDVPLTRRGRTVETDDKDKKDKEAHVNAKYNQLYNEVSNVCYSKLDEEIAKGLADLDKTRPGLKKLIAREARDRILKDMDSDSNFLNRMNGLWQRERRNGFNGSLKNSFVTVFLGKAKTLVAKHRAEARKEALGKEDNTEGNNRNNPPRLTGDRASSGGKKFNKEDAKGKSTRDIFN